MSRNSSHERIVTIANSTEVFEVIREERTSPTPSSVNIDASLVAKQEDLEKDERTRVFICTCKAKRNAEEEEKKNADKVEKLLKEKESDMEYKFQERINSEMRYLKNRFEFILQNEQIRASHMLREAHRERQEKISALQTQLECKNLAGLMYVMCSERRRSKMEKLRITEEYTNYIKALQQILEESQALILNLSRGHKTATRVDHEWREKMKKVIKHFQNFVNNFTGGTPDSNQYLFDLPELLKINTPLKDTPKENPCEAEEETEHVSVIEPDKSWWETLEGDNPPFVMFGDMADFKPPQRRQVLRTVKVAKTAPRKWKQYVFHDMFVKAKCPNSDFIKDEYMKRGTSPEKWEYTAQTDRQTSSRASETSRRVTTASADIRGRMGSILKIMTGVTQAPPKSTLLAARDSMEIASTTRLREKHRHTVEHGKVVLHIGNKIDSMFNEMYEGEIEEEQEEVDQSELEPKQSTSKIEEDIKEESFSALGSIHNDSLQIINSHVPDHDHKIHYEKICPMEKCQKMHMDSFICSLPVYMRANPFTHFEQTYEEYQACTPEQLEILKQRIEEKKKKERVTIDVINENPLSSWTPSLDGIAVQTSDDGISIPPCTCRVPSPSPASSTQMVFNVPDLIPIKQELDRINAEYFFDDDIEFNRFKVIGQDETKANTKPDDEKDFHKNRLQEIKTILKQHPSLCELFQANIRC